MRVMNLLATPITPVDVDLEDVKSVATLTESLLNKDHQINLFIRAAQLSKSKIRFTDNSIVAIASFIQNEAEEILDYYMEATVRREKKIIQPDFISDEELKSRASLYTFFSPLKSYQALVARQKRRTQYDTDKRAWVLKQKAEKDRAKSGKNRKGKKSSKRKKEPEFETWEDREVKEDHAEFVEIEEEDNSVRQVCLWKNIDDFEGVEDSADELDEQLRRYSFNFYIQGIHRKIKAAKAKSDKPKDPKKSAYNDLRISTRI